MILSASDAAAPRRMEADLCIVGAGAAGLDIARGFDRSGVSVIVVESGGLEISPQAQEAARTQSVGIPLRTRAADHNARLPQQLRSESRIRAFGGTTIVWAGRWSVPVPDDFDRKPWIVRSGWPFSYDELLPYYREIASDYGLPEDLFGGEAQVEILRGTGARSPLRAVLHYRQQPALNWNIAFRDALAPSPNVSVMLDAQVVRLVQQAGEDRINHLMAATSDGDAVRVDARVFVLAAGGLENARLLLLSLGAGGRLAHPLVGRCFMEHPKAVWGTLTPSAPRRLKKGLVVGRGQQTLSVGFGIPEAVRRIHRLPNHTTFLRPVLRGSGRAPLDETRDALRQRDLRRLPVLLLRLAWTRPGRILGRLLFRVFGVVAHYELFHQLEQLPHPDSRVYLSPVLRDRRSDPLLAVDWKLTDEELEAFQRYLDVLREAMREEELGEVRYPDRVPDMQIFADAAHHMGTTRMGADPESAVLDRDCRVVGMTNLYVAGSSVFPTAGSAHPMLTILALARRLSRHLSAQWFSVAATAVSLQR